MVLLGRSVFHAYALFPLADYARIQIDGRSGVEARSELTELSAGCAGRRSSRDSSEDRPRHQAGAAGIIEIEEAADQLAGCVESANRCAVGVDHRAFGVDAQTAECKRDAAGDRVTLERWRIDCVRPIALVNREAARRAPVLDVRIEGYFALHRGVVSSHF